MAKRKMSTFERLRSGKMNRQERKEWQQRLCAEDAGLEVVHPDAAGIDVGNASHFVAVPPDRDEPPVREFGSWTADLRRMAEWLKRCRIRTVAMQSTGVYWVALQEILEHEGFEVYLVNARGTKNLPGRKSDVQECQWLMKLHTYGLLRNSFHPPEQIRAVRTIWRQRDRLVKEAGREVQQMQKALTTMNVQLANAWREDVLFELQQVVDAYDFHQKQIAACDVQLQRYLSAVPMRSRLGAGEPSTADAPSEKPKKQRKHKWQKNQPVFDLAVELQRTMGVDMTAIDGVDVMTTQVILSELGPDLSMSFPSESHFTSWLELAPRRDVSGGKVIRQKSRKSNNRVATALRMAAQSLWRSDSYLGARYRHLKARLGGQKAIKAMARYLACLIYRLLTKGQEYVDRGAAHFASKRTERELLALQRKAAGLGMQLVAIS